MVVWVEAAAELSTINNKSLVSTLPSPDVPNTACPKPESTSFSLAGLPRPMPFVPRPAKDCADMITSR